jgi:hypothetical protein
MSEEKTDPPAGGVKMGDLRKMVTDLVSEAVKGITPTAPITPPVTTPGTPAAGGGIQELVQAQIDKIKAADQEKADKQSIQDKLNELSEKTKEKPPVERRRVHKLMGWGE